MEVFCVFALGLNWDFGTSSIPKLTRVFANARV